MVMVMVIVKSTTAYCVFFLLLCAACLSTARLHPTGGGLSDMSSTKAKVKNQLVAIEDGNLKKASGKQEVVTKCGNNNNAKEIIIKRSLRSGEVDAGFVAFTADYHSPRHHPPKNNK